MKKCKLILTLRITAVIMSAAFIALSAALHYFPPIIQSAGIERTVRLSDVLDNDATITEKYESFGINLDIPGVSSGEFVSFTAPQTLHLLGYRSGSMDVDYYKGETMTVCFDSLPTDTTHSDYGLRLVSVSDNYKHRVLSLSEKQLAEAYIAWLQQSGQTELFERETGFELSRRNAIAVLTAADEELYEKGIMLPAAAPRYMRVMRTARNVCLTAMGVSLAMLAAMLVVCHLVDTTDWTENNMKDWAEKSEQRSTIRMKSISESSERAPVEDKNKNKTRQELFRDFK